MELTLETYQKASAQAESSEIGTSRITLAQATYRELEQLENQLKESGQEEMFVEFKQDEMDIDAPETHSDLKDVKLRLFMDEETDAGLFHVVAKSAKDNSLIYTEPSLVRLVPL